MAFALLALVGTALHGVFSGALRNAAAAEDATRAAFIAQSRLAALGYGARLSPGAESGDIADSKFSWTLEIRPYEPPPGSEGAVAGVSAVVEPSLGAKLLEAQVRVSWPGPGGGTSSVSLTTLRLVPVE